ncbi:hypothetical protein Ddye_025425 [Dipteronia dyeriana]|uniref:N-acetyltransferase domain-containing protein n=1 Tax=Dipteronia dyeriana TaxID=168575 RepID=A0AAD9TLC6_9ROSI|nr:hypothetical protein Ddye_025425 [Dipteronia dyeriana]
MEIDSSTTILRPFKLSDVDDFMIWASDDQVMRPWNTFTSKEEALTYIKDVCIPTLGARSIYILDRWIGIVLIYPGSDDDRCRADIRYAVAVEFWGQGMATKAVKIALSEVSKDFPEVVRLQAYVDVQNKAYQRVLEKVGFLHEGLLRKYCYLKGQ